MTRGLDSRSEAALVAKLAEALTSSLEVRVVLERAYPLLTALVPADYGALGVAGSSAPNDFEWTVVHLPDAFFRAYPELAAHDFVHRAVVARPNVVMRDQDIIRRAELEKNVMYTHARDVGVPIEHVMAVMLHADERWQSGLSLYRARRRPFSTSERSALGRVAPVLANTVRNCRIFGQARDWHAALDAMLEPGPRAALLVTANGVELDRSPRATALIERWFLPHERRGTIWTAALAALLAPRDKSARGRTAWRSDTHGRVLEARCFTLPRELGRPAFAILLHERNDIPRAWAGRLTPKEREVFRGVRRGWDNRLIAEVLGCAGDTVKKHVSSIFDKVGVDSRAALTARACELDEAGDD